MKSKRLVVTKETKTGRNEEFRDTKTNEILSRKEVVKRIKDGIYKDYIVKIIDGIETPVSKPDGKSKNNLD